MVAVGAALVDGAGKPLAVVVVSGVRAPVPTGRVGVVPIAVAVVNGVDELVLVGIVADAVEASGSGVGAATCGFTSMAMTSAEQNEPSMNVTTKGSQPAFFFGGGASLGCRAGVR